METPHSPHIFRGRYIRDLVFGANDGIITTFAIVASVAGADLSAGVVLVLGFANLLADGFSMAAGNYLGERSERGFIQAEQEEVVRAIRRSPDEARDALTAVYHRQGFRGRVLADLVRIVSGRKAAWAEALTVGRLGLPTGADSRPEANALAIFSAFVLAGSVPLLPYIFGAGQSFFVSIAGTAVALFVLGALRTTVTRQGWLMSGVEMLVVGAIAAAVAYTVGAVAGTVVPSV